MQPGDAAAVDRVIRERKTIKVFADEPSHRPLDRAVIEELLQSASWAPFHRPASEVHRSSGPLSSPVPWRFHVLDAVACDRLRARMLGQGVTGKVPKMLAAASALIQATWLPNPSSDTDAGLFAANLGNMEHIAAASAAIQNLLLAATARGIRNYWSSGGVLRDQEVFDWLQIPAREILLGAVFLFPSDIDGMESAPGKLRDARGPLTDSTRWVSLPTTD